MKIHLKLLAASVAAVTALSCASVNAFADKLKTVDGIRYRYSDTGELKGKFTGWVTGKSGAKYYYKNGVKLKSTWIKNKDGNYRYADSSGKMVTGWSDAVRGNNGSFSWFGENGYWDGRTYYSRYNDAEKFGSTVKIKVSRNEIINEPTGHYLDNGLGSEKKAKAYVLNNTEYELELPLGTADQLKVGDKLIISPNVRRGEKADGEYKYNLCIYTLYSPDRYSNDSFNNYSGKDEKQVTEEVTQARMELFNKLLLVRSGKAKLDKMWNAYGLDWKYISGEEFYKEPYIHVRTYLEDDEYKYDLTYGLFGGYNDYDKETGKYTYRNNISEKKLKKLITSQITKHKEDIERSKNDDVDYKDWVTNMSALWLDVTVTDIPELPLSIEKRKFIGPPELLVTSYGNTCKAYAGTSSWMNSYADIGGSVEQEDDADGALHSDALNHPLNALVPNGVQLEFMCSKKPKTITVKCWKDEYRGDYAAYDKFETVTVEDLRFTPKKGGYIYEIHASWDKFTDNDVTMSGNCYYTVYIIGK